MRLLAKLKEKSGQSAIEFIAIVVVIFFFLLLFLSLTILIVTSEYLDFATFMAARTYRSGFSDQAHQQQYATQVFDMYKEKVNGIARNIDLKFVEGGGGDQTAGVVATYNIDLFYLPPFFIQGNQPPSRINLTSETHLGRDPTIQDCQGYFSSFAEKFNLGIQGSSLLQQMDDNGC
jgi:hypothetical protein